MDVQTVALIGASLVIVFLALLVWAVKSRTDLMNDISRLKTELELSEIKVKDLEYDNEKLLESLKSSERSTHVAEKVALEAINDVTALFRVAEEQSLEPTYIYDKIKEKYDLRLAIETGEFSMEGRV